MYFKAQSVLLAVLAREVFAVPHGSRRGSFKLGDLDARSGTVFSLTATKNGGNYFMPIKVGSQSFNVIADTGSQGL